MGELKNQLDVHNTFMKQSQPDDAKVKCANITADLIAETAMAWHLEAVGSGGVRGTGDRKTMVLAAQLYDMVVKTFKQEDFAKFEFPRIVKEDWPNIFKIKYAMADLLWFQKDWAKCGPAFDAVVAEDPDRPHGSRGRVRGGALLPEHLHRAAPGRRRQEEQRQPPLHGEEGRQAQERQGEGPRPQGLHRRPEGHDHGLQPLHLLHQARRQQQGGARELRRGQVRPWPHLLRGSALGGGGARVPRRRDDLPRQGGGHLRRAVLPRVAQRARRRASSRPARPASTTWRRTCRCSSRSTAGRQGQAERRPVRHPHPDPARHRAAPRRGAGQARAGRAGADAPKMFEKGATAYLELWKKYSEKACEEKTAGLRARRGDPLQRCERLPGGAAHRQGDRGPQDPHRPQVQPQQHRAPPRRRCTRSAPTTRRSPSTTRRRAGTSATRRRTPRPRRRPRR